MGLSAALLAVLVIAAGCGAYRTGYISMPYVGEAAPSAEPERGARGWDHLRYLTVHGITLYVNLMNDVETSETRTHLNNRRFAPGNDCILLYVRPAIAGVSLEPRRISMSVDGAARAVVGTIQRFLGTGSRSEEVTDPRVALAQDQWSRFRVCFAGEKADPAQNISLDLNQALRHPEPEPFPLIRFQLRRFRHLYS